VGDSLRVEENGRLRWVAGGRGAQLVLGPSGALLEQLLARARRVSVSRRGNPRDSVTLRVFEASGRAVQTVAFRWTDDGHASATSEGGAGPTIFHWARGLLRAVIYAAPPGMQIVRVVETR